MRGYPFWAFLATLALTGGAQAQPYTLKFKYVPDVGKGVVVTESGKDTGLVKVTDADGNVLFENKNQTEGSDEVYTETVLEKGDKQPRKFKRAYEKARRTQEGKTTARSFEGRTLVFEMKDGKYVVTAEGDKPINKQDLTELAAKANEGSPAKEEVFLPKKAVKVGDTWKLDNKELAAAFGAKGYLDPENTSGEGKLVKVYEKGGKQFGRIEMKLKISPKPPPEVKVEKPVVAEMTITLDTAIDGSSTEITMTMTGKLTGKTTQERNGKKNTVEFNRDITGKKEQSAEK